LHLPIYIIPAAALVAGIFGVVLGAPNLQYDYSCHQTLGFVKFIRVFWNNLTAPSNLTTGPGHQPDRSDCWL
jgi:branched-chain amino acid transport system permease protein